MKKSSRFLSLLLVFLLVSALVLAGCGATGSDTPLSAPAAVMEETTESASGSTGGLAAQYSYRVTSNEAGDAEAPAPDADTAVPAGEDGAEDGGGSASINSEKIIYSAYAQVETTDYESAVEGVYALVEKLGGFMESTSVSGRNYSDTARGRETNRSAEFVIRVPSEHFSQLTGSLSELGNVPYCNTYSENVTRQYYDVQSRLEAYQTQEERLLEMLAIAETVEDMLAIQQQLTEVQYEIDSLTSTLDNYDNEVRYSTVTISLQEVTEYTPQPTVTLSYWERMAEGFRRSLKRVGTFFTDLFLQLVSNLPVLVLIAALVVAAVLLLRRLLRRRTPGKTRPFRKKRPPEPPASSDGDAK